MAAALSTRAKQAFVRGDLAALKRDGEHSFALFFELGDRWGQLQATEWLGGLAQITGDYEQATSLHRDGLRMAGELGLWPQAADRLSWLGRVALLVGGHAQAREFHEAMRLAAEQGHKPGESFAEIGLGARREGKLNVAETHLRNVLEWNHQVDFEPGGAAVPLHPTPHAEILAELGFVAEQRGDAAAALALHLEGFAVARRLGDPRAVALALEGLAGARALAGQHGHAALLLGAADTARESAGAPLPAAERGDVNRITAPARAALGEEAFAAEFERGARLNADEARSVGMR